MAPYVAANFTCYEALRAWFAKRHEHGSPTTAEKLACGALAGTTAQTCRFLCVCAHQDTNAQMVVTYPMDVVRRRMQVHRMPGSAYTYKSTADAFITIARLEGVKGLFKGMVPNILKVAPLNATSFVTYELMKTLLQTN